MKCNIDARGRRVRGLLGAACCAIGGALLAWGLVRDVSYPLVFTGGGFALGGLFQLYEARAGWCALRAMGIRTRV
jgi:hypothetical protein